MHSYNDFPASGILSDKTVSLFYFCFFRVSVKSEGEQEQLPPFAWWELFLSFNLKKQRIQELVFRPVQALSTAVTKVLKVSVQSCLAGRANSIHISIAIFSVFCHICRQIKQTQMLVSKDIFSKRTAHTRIGTISGFLNSRSNTSAILSSMSMAGLAFPISISAK